MKFIAKREQLLKPLQYAIGLASRRHTIPILTNILIISSNQSILITATDLDMELSIEINSVIIDIPGKITVSARKFFDIIRALPEGSEIVVISNNEMKVNIFCGRSKFTLISLSPADFPTIEDLFFNKSLKISRSSLRKLIENTHFAMAQQDVRYYLNGLLLELYDSVLKLVATDGHRLAIQKSDIEINQLELEKTCMIIPRKVILEILRILSSSNNIGNTEQILVLLSKSHIRLKIGFISLTSKVIDGQFPDYEQVIPSSGYILLTDANILKNALARASIILKDKINSYGTRLRLNGNVLTVYARNLDQEEVEEEVEVQYNGIPIEISFNVSYLLDALGALKNEVVKITLNDSESSCLIEGNSEYSCKHIIMPMRL